MRVRMEYMGEDKEFPNSRIWKVEAIHVTTTRNKRKFTESELSIAGRSLSFRPLNINHEQDRTLKFPENATLGMHFDKEKLCVSGQIRIAEQSINAQIESGFLSDVSIEQIPTLGEKCDEVLCEQHGVAFIGMALLEAGVAPGDPRAGIRKETASDLHSESISDLLISDGQRTCTECTDFEMCETCGHNHQKKEFDEIMENCLETKARAHPEMPMDLRVISCLEELNRVNSPAFKGITIQLNETMSRIENHVNDGSELLNALQMEQLTPEMAHYFYSVAKEKKHNESITT